MAMKIGDLTAPALAQTPVGERARPRRQSFPLAAEVFGRMYGAYGNLWLDKWATGQLDSAGHDRGVQSAMASWEEALQPFPPPVLHKACDAVFDGRRRPRAEFPPSLPEFIEACRASMPRLSSDRMLVDRTNETLHAEGRARIAEIRARHLAEAARSNRINAWHDLISEAVILAGGSREDLTSWQMLRPTGEEDDGASRRGGAAAAGETTG